MNIVNDTKAQEYFKNYPTGLSGSVVIKHDLGSQVRAFVLDDEDKDEIQCVINYDDVTQFTLSIEWDKPFTIYYKER
jgi:hypothetical protein